jgi:hypothetical protein
VWRECLISGKGQRCTWSQLRNTPEMKNDMHVGVPTVNPNPRAPFHDYFQGSWISPWIVCETLVSALATSIELLIEKLRPWWNYGRSLRCRKSDEIRKHGRTWTARQSPRAAWTPRQFFTVRTFDMFLTGQKLGVNFRLSNACQKPQILYVLCTWCLGTLFRNLTRHSSARKSRKEK